MKNTEIVPLQIEDKIIELRNQKVILDRDVATIYDVETKRVNEAVKNNPKKFPDGYIFKLNVNELNNLKTLATKSELTDNEEPVETFDRSLNIKHIAEINAFTEKGLYMLATILKSDRAIDATIEIVEAFAKLRELQNTLASINIEEPEVIEPEIVEKTGGLLSDLFFSHLPTTSEETSFEFNLGVMKGKRTITSNHDSKNVQNRFDELERMIEKINKRLDSSS